MNKRQAMLVSLQNLDILIREVATGHEQALGFRVDKLEQLVKGRSKLAAKLDEKDLTTYERVAKRYDVVSAVVPVQDRNCLGCFMGLPTSALRKADEDEELLICENCGRILYWV
jgi:predicted  nucleic acid-binding Zn-ribbon protein